MVTAQLRSSFLRYFSSIHWTNIDHSAPSEFLLMYSIHCSLFSRLTCSSIYVYPVLPSPHLLRGQENEKKKSFYVLWELRIKDQQCQHFKKKKSLQEWSERVIAQSNRKFIQSHFSVPCIRQFCDSFTKKKIVPFIRQLLKHHENLSITNKRLHSFPVML